VASDEQDVLILMNEFMGFAEETLLTYGEFFPYGAAMKTDGETVPVAAVDGAELPDSQQVIDFLNEGFMAGAASGEYRATALFYDTKITRQVTGENSNAVAVALDHRGGASAVVFVPYFMGRAGLFRRKQVSFDAPFSQEGMYAIFGKPTPGN